MRKKRVRVKQEAFQTIAVIVLAVIIFAYIIGIFLLQRKYAFRNHECLSVNHSGTFVLSGIVSIICIIINYIAVYVYFDAKYFGKRNPKQPKRRKEPKNAKKLRIIMAGFFITGIVFIILSFPITVFSRYELRNDGIYQFNGLNNISKIYRINASTTYELGIQKHYRCQGGVSYQSYIAITAGNMNMIFTVFRSEKEKFMYFLEKKRTHHALVHYEHVNDYKKENYRAMPPDIRDLFDEIFSR